MPINKKNLWQPLSFSGAIGVITYAAHVIIGGILWKGYNPITQTISELTGSGGPNADFLKIFTNIYGVLTVIFSLYLFFAFKKYKVNKTALIGAILLIIMETTSFIGYSLFPLDNVTIMNFQNIMHIVVTAVVVVCTIGSCFFIGIGLIHISSLKKLGIFVLICAITITVSGAFTPITMANKIMVAGLVERINIFTLQTCIFVLSVYFFRKEFTEA